MKPETAYESFKNPKFKKLLELLDFLLKKRVQQCYITNLIRIIYEILNRLKQKWILKKFFSYNRKIVERKHVNLLSIEIMSFQKAIFKKFLNKLDQKPKNFCKISCAKYFVLTHFLPMFAFYNL